MFIFLQSYVLQTTPTVRQMKLVYHRAGGVMVKLIAQPEKMREYTAVSRQDIWDSTSDDIGIKHVFSCINVPHIPREMFKTEGEASVSNISLTLINALNTNV